ncbi:MAG: MATE family efflux transporter [Muricoprocola sp.]
MNKTQRSWKNKFFGDRAFYKMILAIAIPIMIQNGITNFVNLLDNIMIGQIGTNQMSGASIVNQLIFVYNLCIFGGVSGAGIFTAQYYGQGDQEGVRNTFRFKFWLVILLTGATVILFLLKGEFLIQLYLKGNGNPSDAAKTLAYGLQYMKIMLIGLIPFMISQAYSSTLRECGETILPMKAGIVSVLVNLIFNYLLIYGKFGFPVLGVRGAAIATVLSRYVEMLIIIIFSHRDPQKYKFTQGLYKTMTVPLDLIQKIIIKGMPLLVNETLWAAGMAMITQCYSVRGLHVVAALNITTTISNVFNIVFMALGDSVAIVVGQLLGANRMKEARDTDTKMIVFAVLSCSVVAVLMLFVAPFFPRLYNTSGDVRALATRFIMIVAICMPQNAFLHACYFTLRSGGKTIITFLFDSVFLWCINVTLAFTLSRFTALSVVAIYIIVQFGDTLKAILGYILVKKGIWINNIVS